MKKLVLGFAMIALTAILLVTACKKSNDKLLSEEQTTMSAKRGDAAAEAESADDQQGLVAAFYKRNGPKTETYQIDASEDAEIKLPSGGVIYIPAGAFAINGKVINSGKVDVAVKDLPNRAAMALSGVNTMVGDQILESNGNFNLEASVNGEAVDRELAQGQMLKVVVPDQIKNGKDLNLFEGVENDQKQFDWVPAKVNGQADNIPVSSGSYSFSWPTTGWCNPDWFWNNVTPGSTYTTLQVDLTNNPGPLSNYLGGNGNTTVLLVPQGRNIIIHVYTPNGGGVKSYDNSIPVGIQCRLLAYSVTSSGYYMASDDFVTTGTSTSTLTKSLTFGTTTESALTAALTALSSY